MKVDHQPAANPKDPPVLTLVQRVNSLRWEISMAIAKHYGECSAMLVFYQKRQEHGTDSTKLQR